MSSAERREPIGSDEVRYRLGRFDSAIRETVLEARAVFQGQVEEVEAYLLEWLDKLIRQNKNLREKFSSDDSAAGLINAIINHLTEKRKVLALGGWRALHSVVESAQPLDPERLLREELGSDDLLHRFRVSFETFLRETDVHFKEEGPERKHLHMEEKVAKVLEEQCKRLEQEGVISSVRIRRSRYRLERFLKSLVDSRYSS